jgi:hypothetical protein
MATKLYALHTFTHEMQFRDLHRHQTQPSRYFKQCKPQGEFMGLGEKQGASQDELTSENSNGRDCNSIGA